MSDTPNTESVLCAECMCRHRSNDDNAYCVGFTPVPDGMTALEARNLTPADRRLMRAQIDGSGAGSDE